MVSSAPGQARIDIVRHSAQPLMGPSAMFRIMRHSWPPSPRRLELRCGGPPPGFVAASTVVAAPHGRLWALAAAALCNQLCECGLKDGGSGRVEDVVWLCTPLHNAGRSRTTVFNSGHGP